MTVNIIENHRRLCILKDIKELELWIYALEHFNEELNHFIVLEKQLLKNIVISNTIKAIRRKNILFTATLCKYEQNLKIEYEYGKVEYDSNRSKYHEQRREEYLKLWKEYYAFKNQIYKQLLRFKR